MASRDRSQEPFELRPDRLYEVGRDGVPRTDAGDAMEWLGPRHRRLILAVAGAAAIVAGLAGATALVFMAGGRVAAALLALATIAATPLLLLGPALDWWRHRRGRRQRHRRRPARFPGGGEAG